MPFVPFTPLPPQFVDSTGTPLNGGTLEFFIAGTSTPTNIYSDSSGTSLGDTVTLNSQGYPESGSVIVNLFRDTDVDYKVTHDDASAVAIYTVDNLNALTSADIPFSDAGGNFTSSATTVDEAVAEAVGVRKIRTSDDPKTSDDTLAADSDLSGWSLVAGARYSVEGFIAYTQNVGDFKWTFSFTNTPVSSTQQCMYTASDSNQNTVTDAGDLDDTFAVVTFTDGAAYNGIHIIGSFRANLTTGGTMDLQWAQNTSNANATTIKQSSFIRVSRLA